MMSQKINEENPQMSTTFFFWSDLDNSERVDIQNSILPGLINGSIQAK